MKLNEFYKLLKGKQFTDYVVFIRYKYDTEIAYTYSKEVLCADLNSSNNYLWVNDWWEGQTDVDVLGFIELALVYVPLNLYFD